MDRIAKYGWVVALVLFLFIMFSDKLTTAIAEKVALIYATQLKDWQAGMDQKLVGLYNNFDKRITALEPPGSEGKVSTTRKGG